MKDTLPTADQLESVFLAALEAQDFEGVMAALRVMIGVDSDRALRLHQSLQDAVNLAQTLDRIRSAKDGGGATATIGDAGAHGATSGEVGHA